MALRLLGTPRSFPDLPAKWDGETMLWEAWEKRVAVTHLDNECEGCGLGSSLWQASGWYARSSTGTAWKQRGMRNFRSTRCGWCGHTTVFTMHDEQSWTLDESDYRPEGSYGTEDIERLFWADSLGLCTHALRSLSAPDPSHPENVTSSTSRSTSS